MKDFRNIKAWHRAHGLTLQVYKITESFPKEELYGLTSQLRRAIISVPTNIAEGCGRDTDPELARFIDIAAGSASEVDYLLLLAKELSYLEKESYRNLFDELTMVRKMLTSLNKTIRQSINNKKANH